MQTGFMDVYLVVRLRVWGRGSGRTQSGFMDVCFG